MESKIFSRRGFLGVASTASLAGGLALVGCSAASSFSGDDREGSTGVEHNPTKTEEFDIVVVGSGTSGTCAALRAAEAGAKVICLEKQSTLGGSSVMTRGLCGINTRYQAEQGISIDKSEIMTETMQYHHHACSGPIVKTFISECGATVDWYEDHGITFSSVLGLGGSRRVWHIPADQDGNPSNTKYMLAQLQSSAEELGVEFRVDCEVTGLIVQDGVVSGVYAAESDGEIGIQCSSVIMATGGYSDSKEIYEQYTARSFESVKAWGVPGRDGDGISFSVNEANAAVHCPGAVMFHTGTVESAEKFNDPINFAILWQPTLRVNEQSERYFDESIVGDFSATGNVLVSQAGNYVLFDDAYIDMLETEGPLFGAPALGIKANEPYKCREIIEQCVDVVSADSWEELASLLDLNGAVLSETVRKYNAVCASGVDTDFGRTLGLNELLTPPYYGAKVIPTYFSTVGGLRVTNKMEVVDKTGRIIPGLYAVGCDAGGLYGADYDVSISTGSQQGWCATSGRLAAEAATA